MQHTNDHQTSKGALVATVNETMAALKIGRAKMYELINNGQLQSYVAPAGRHAVAIIFLGDIESANERHLLIAN